MQYMKVFNIYPYISVLNIYIYEGCSKNSNVSWKKRLVTLEKVLVI